MTNKKTVRRQRAIQKQVAVADKKRPKEETRKSMQAGSRIYPAPPFPKQHKSKPGIEAVLVPPPMYDAPFYKGSGKLQDKVALITGGDSGIGRSVAILFAREGANVVILHLNEHKDASETKAKIEAKAGSAFL